MAPVTQRVVYGKRQTRAVYTEFSSPIKAPSPLQPTVLIHDGFQLERKNKGKENEDTVDLSERLKILGLCESDAKEAASLITQIHAPSMKSASRILSRIDANATGNSAASVRNVPNSPSVASFSDRVNDFAEVPSTTPVSARANTPSPNYLLAGLPDINSQSHGFPEQRRKHDTPHLSPGYDTATRSEPLAITSASPSSNSQGSTASTPPPLDSPIQHTLPERPRRTTRNPLQTDRTAFSAHAAPLLSLSNDPSLHPTSFTTWATSLSSHFSIIKIAEASYGEVYRLSLLRPHPRFTRADESVLKLIALKPPPPAPGAPALTKAARARAEAMSAVADVAGEVCLLRRMTPVPGFTNFRDVRVVQGRAPAPLVDAWRAFDRDVRRSDFPDPGKRTSYPDTQLWAVVEMQDAGVDLETRVVRNVWEAWDAFWGIASALAKGEEYAEYEHRDLHLGNVCVRWPPPALGRDERAPTSPRSLARKLGYTGLETTIIDYTLSRASIADAVAPAFLDLARDASLFEGDGSVEYQYDIYRHMRAAVLTGDPLAVCDDGSASSESEGGAAAGDGPWSAYHPITNLVWLHFVLHMLCKTIQWPSNGPRDVREDVADVAASLEAKLRTLSERLELKRLGPRERIWESAGTLVAWAVEQEWLDKEDIIELSRQQKRSGRRRADKRTDKVVA